MCLLFFCPYLSHNGQIPTSPHPIPSRSLKNFGLEVVSGVYLDRSFSSKPQGASAWKAHFLASLKRLDVSWLHPSKDDLNFEVPTSPLRHGYAWTQDPSCVLQFQQGITCRWNLRHWYALIHFSYNIHWWCYKCTVTFAGFTQNRVVGQVFWSLSDHFARFTHLAK